MRQALAKISSPAKSDNEANEEKTMKPAASNSHIAKLERALKMVQKKIRQLEEKEVDFDAEEEDDTYDLLCRYRDKCVKIYQKISELKGMEQSLGRKQDKRFRWVVRSQLLNIIQRTQLPFVGPFQVFRISHSRGECQD